MRYINPRIRFLLYSRTSKYHCIIIQGGPKVGPVSLLVIHVVDYSQFVRNERRCYGCIERCGCGDWDSNVTYHGAVMASISTTSSNRAARVLASVNHNRRQMTAFWDVHVSRGLQCIDHCRLLTIIARVYSSHPVTDQLSWLVAWQSGRPIERRSLTGELSLSCAGPTDSGLPLMWVNRPL